MKTATNNRNGIVLMIAAMAGFTLEDLFIKKLSSTVSTGQILITLGICSSLIFGLIAYLNNHKIFVRQAWTKITVVRIFAEAIAAVFFVISLAKVPLATVAAILQATPLIITMGAALFLGEQVGWRRWLAIVIGFVGVLLIVRPGLTSFDPAVMFVLISVLGITVRDLLTRLISHDVHSSVVSFQAFASLIFAGAITLLISSDPLVSINRLEASYFLGGVIFGVAGYYGIVSALRIGTASAVSPYRYSRLVFSIIVGVIVFNEYPDLLTLAGAAIIVVSGLYTFVREHKIEQAYPKAA